jgi:hypothetical protein
MKINYVLLQEPKEEEIFMMDIEVQPAEAEEENQPLPILDKFSFHKEGEATSKRFLHLYDASAESMTSALYKKWMRNISNIRAQQFSKQSFLTDKNHANNNIAKDKFTSRGGHLIPVLPDFLMAFTSLPERAKWIEGLIDLHPESETLQYLKETIVLELKEIRRLTEGFGKLTKRDEFTSFRY